MILSVIIPVHNAAEWLPQCLGAIGASTRAPAEIIVVDDASTDDSARLARERGACVIALRGAPRGPAFSRNRGAEAARGDVLVFLDADVCVHPDTFARLETYFAEYPELDALFGSYDDAPAARGLVSQYKNLLHHYVHQHSAREATTFWAGCGALRRATFESARGFDEQYALSSVEDIELGTRLKRAGKTVWLCADIQVTHLKRWTLTSLLRSDVFDRAIPWTRLILQNGVVSSDLNLNWASRASALFAWALVAFLALGAWTRAGWIGAATAFIALLILNFDLYVFFARRGGIFFAVGAMGLHLLYFLYSSGVFGGMILIDRSQRIWRIVQRVGTPRYAIWLLLMLTLVKGLAWSIIVPPWHAPDEITHFTYAQIIERFHVLHPEPGNWVNEEIAVSWQIAQIHPVRFDPNKIFDLSDRAGIAGQIQRLNNPAVKSHYVYDNGQFFPFYRDFTYLHPPLYYFLAAVIQNALDDKNILIRILAERWLSVFSAVVLTALAWRAGLVMFQNEAWALLLATLVSFQPMVTFMTSVVSNNSLEIAMYSACLLALLMIARRGLSRRGAVTLGVLIGASLLTRSSLVSIIPLVVVIFIWDIYHLNQSGYLNGHHVARWAIAFGTPVILAGWWYLGLSALAAPTVINAPVQAGTAPQISFWSRVATYDWSGISRRLAEMYWGDFGWLDTPMPSWLWNVLIGISVLAYVLTLVWLIRRVVQPAKSQSVRPGTILFLGAAIVSLTAFFFYLDLIPGYTLQGRYFLAPIVAQMGWLALGLVWIAPARWRAAWMWFLGAGMIALNLFSLFDVIPLRYYGARNLLLVADRATVFQPVHSDTLVALCAVLFLLTGAFLLVAWRVFKQNMPAAV